MNSGNEQIGDACMAKCKCVLGSLLIWLLASGSAEAANFRVNWVQELSSRAIWRFELINQSVDPLYIQQLTVTFYAEGRRFWSEPVAISPSSLRPGESGWVSLDTSTLPKVLPLRIDWEATWNPYYVPVLPKYWNKELVASVEIDANAMADSSGPAFDAPRNYGSIESRPAPPGKPKASTPLPTTGEM
jgi:hypothetical protein